MKSCVFIAFVILGVAQTVLAQDVIVKKDGSTILSKVLEINSADVKYKKFSNPNGPTYSVNKSDILAINYENGDKDTFENENNDANTSGSNSGSGSQAAHYDASLNQRLIDDSNNVPIGWTEAPKQGAGTYHAFWRVKISEGSVLETNDVQLTLSTPCVSDEGGIVETPIPSNGVFLVTVKNKTSRTIFLDLGNTFFIRNNEAQAYYVPSKTTNYVGGSTGTGVNMGAVAGALGIGGAAGTLANGINVSRTNSSGTSTETFSQRVIAVPPMSAKSLDPQVFVTKSANLSSFFHYDEVVTNTAVFRKLCTLVKDFDRGDMVHFHQQESPFHLSFFLSYAFDETCSAESTVKVDMYASDLYMLAINPMNNNIKYFKDSWRKTLHFFTNTPMPGQGLKKKSVTLDRLGGILEHGARK